MDIISYAMGKKAGGTPVSLQDKEITITTNGKQTITFDTGYNGLRTVKITTEVAGPSRTITFNSMGGSSIATQTVTIGDTATEPEDPTKDGYNFDGWYTESTYVHEYNFDTPVINNITLYAKWVEPTPTYTVVGTQPNGTTPLQFYKYVQGEEPVIKTTPGTIEGNSCLKINEDWETGRSGISVRNGNMITITMGNTTLVNAPVISESSINVSGAWGSFYFDGMEDASLTINSVTGNVVISTTQQIQTTLNYTVGGNTGYADGLSYRFEGKTYYASMLNFPIRIPVGATNIHADYVSGIQPMKHINITMGETELLDVDMINSTTYTGTGCSVDCSSYGESSFTISELTDDIVIAVTDVSGGYTVYADGKSLYPDDMFDTPIVQNNGSATFPENSNINFFFSEDYEGYIADEVDIYEGTDDTGTLLIHIPTGSYGEYNIQSLPNSYVNLEEMYSYIHINSLSSNLYIKIRYVPE